MAASGYTPISLYHSTTPAAAPTAGNLVDGELAINIADGKLYYKDDGGVVQSISGGGVISNDTSTSSNRYPLFAAATSGDATSVYTSDAKYLYKPSTGELQAYEIVATNGLLVNNATVSASYTVATGNNAFSVGPVTVASGVSVTVSSGQRWVVI